MRIRSCTTGPLQVTLLVAALALLAGLLFPAEGEAGGAASFERAYPPPSEIIVRFAPRAEFSVAARSMTHWRAGGTRVRGLRGMPGYELVRVPVGLTAEEAALRYRTDPAVLYAEPNYPIHVAMVPDDPLFGDQWALHNVGQDGGVKGADIGALEAWTYTTGSDDVLIAVVDTGVDYEHPDLVDNMWPDVGWDFTEDDADPMDVHGHGTHVAGIIGASGNDGYGIAGVTWNASIMALKAIRDDGSGKIAHVAEAVTYASANGADIINLSLGGTDESQTLYDAIVASDALIVAAAGNNGEDNSVTPFYPASYCLDHIISVAATNRHDELAWFSNYGDPDVDLAAPGVDILSTVPGRNYITSTVFSDRMDTLEAWSTERFEHDPWTLSSTVHASPPSSAGHVPPGGSMPNEDAWLLMSEHVSLSEADAVVVRFKARFNPASGDDSLVLYTNEMGSDSWEHIGYIAESTGEVFRTFEADLSGLAGSSGRVGFRFLSGDTGGGKVWVDDVELIAVEVGEADDYSETHTYKSGTSMAASHVSGVAALLRAYNPGLDADALKDVILASATPLDSLAGKVLTGGRLDAASALALAAPDPGPADPKRISDRTRFSTAVRIAEEGFPGWEGVTDVVIASGDDRAAADPLAASGLCWAYDSPMLLVSAARTPDEVKTAIAQIVATNGPITLRVVGGPVSVPDARIDEIKAHVGSANVSVDRIRRTGSRFDLAYSIAMRMRSVANADPEKTMPSVALLANGADATKFFDALALSPISAGTGAPILLVSHDSVPGATASALNTLDSATKIVGGGPNTVSESVLAQLGAERWWGQTRYDTAIEIADKAVDQEGWLTREAVGVAAVLPDALIGGAFIGLEGGVLVLTDGTSLTPTTCDWLISHKVQVRKAYVFGGPNSVSPGVKTQIRDALE